jgi:hypothetical protein
MICYKKVHSNSILKKSLSQSFWIVLISLISISIRAQNPTYLLELRNDVQVSATEYEFDVYLLRTGTIPFEYATGQYGILINSEIKNGGTIIASLVPSSLDPELAASNQAPSSVSFFDQTSVIRIAPPSPPGAGKGAIISNIPPGTRICRIRLSNTVPFGQYRPNLTWTTTTIYPTQVYAYVGTTNTKITDYANHTISNLVNPVLNEVTSSESYINEDYGFRVFPNPFRERINIDYRLNHNSFVRLSVFDLAGKQVGHLVDEIQQAGSYSLSWSSDSQPEGIYLIKLQTGETAKISRVTLIR